MEIVGGGPTSRLAQSLRQREALTYDVRAHGSARRFGGLLTISTSVAHEAAGATLSAIHREIARLRDERVSIADIEQARRALHGADLRLFQDLIGTGATLGSLAMTGDPAVHLERRRTAMETIGPDALRDLARRHLAAERLHSIVAGPATALRSQLAGAEAYGTRLSSTTSPS
jgi:predicted Zn-dependent peptidase